MMGKADECWGRTRQTHSANRRGMGSGIRFKRRVREIIRRAKGVSIETTMVYALSRFGKTTARIGVTLS